MDMAAGLMMAEDGLEPDGRTNGGKTDHRGTYDAFMSMTKMGIGAVAVVLILMAVFLA